jgi:hypothetical protein
LQSIMTPSVPKTLKFLKGFYALIFFGFCCVFVSHPSPAVMRSSRGLPLHTVQRTL